MLRPMLARRMLALLSCLGAVTLCSCTGAPPYDAAGKFWLRQPPPVAELVPPQIGSSVQIRLAPGFRHSCSELAVRPLAVPDPPVALTEEYVRWLASEQDRLLQGARSLSVDAREQMGLAALECAAGMAALRDDGRKKWQKAQDVAFRQIVSDVLSYKQRTYYERQSRKRKPREQIFAWLDLTSDQKSQMARIYERHLQECQPAWTLSESFRTSTHTNLDRLLSACAESISRSRATCVAYDTLQKTIEAADRDFRESQRQLAWMEARLEAEKEPKEQIRLRKDIADKRVDAEELKVKAARNSRLMQAHVWRFKDVAKAALALDSQFEVLREMHDAYSECTSLVSSLDGRASSQCAGIYASLEQSLRKAIQLVGMHSGHFPPGCMKAITKTAGE